MRFHFSRGRGQATTAKLRRTGAHFIKGLIAYDFPVPPVDDETRAKLDQRIMEVYLAKVEALNAACLPRHKQRAKHQKRYKKYQMTRPTLSTIREESEDADDEMSGGESEMPRRGPRVTAGRIRRLARSHHHQSSVIKSARPTFPVLNEQAFTKLTLGDYTPQARSWSRNSEIREVGATKMTVRLVADEPEIEERMDDVEMV